MLDEEASRMERVVLTRVGPNLRVYFPKEVKSVLKVENHDLLAWELGDGEARVFKARISKETG